MGRKKESDSGDNVATSNWKLLLYPDNEVHVRVLENVKQIYPESFIYCEHINYDEEGHIIEQGEGKKHIHVGLIHDPHKAIRRGSLCKKIGLIDPDSGLPDFRFLQPVYGYFYRFLPYLTHRNCPDKEQYFDSDLVGAPAMIALYRRGAIECESKAFELRECVSAVVSWVLAHDSRISYAEFAKWIIGTPYFRCRNERIVWAVIEEHNAKCAQRDFEMIQNSYPVYQQQIAMASGGRSVFLGSECVDVSELEELL